MDANFALREIETLIAELFPGARGPIAMETACIEIPGWDSLAQTLVVLSLEERLGLSIPLEGELVTIGDLVRAVLEAGEGV